VIEFRILGPFTVLDDGKPVSIQGAKERAVLAILLLNTGQVVSADPLIDALWETETPATARNSLHVRIAALRKTLGSARIETKPTTSSRQMAEVVSRNQAHRLQCALGNRGLASALPTREVSHVILESLPVPCRRHFNARPAAVACGS